MTMHTTCLTAQQSKLVEEHMHRVPGMAFKFWRKYAEVSPINQKEDFSQHGMLGLIYAAIKFDPAKDTLFFAYAKKSVIGAMYNLIQETSWRSRQDTHALRTGLSRATGRPVSGKIEDRATFSHADFDEFTHPDPADPVKAAEESEILSWIRKSLSEIPERQRKAFALYACRDLNYHELADAMGMSRPGASYAYQAAQKKLQAKLTSVGLDTY